MKKLRSLLALLCSIGALLSYSQDFSNKGKDFWLGYGYHVSMVSSTTGDPLTNGGSQEMVLYFTSDKNAKVTVEVPGVGYSQQYTVTANQVTISAPLPKTTSLDCRISGPGLFNTGIHITSDEPVVAYAHIYNASISGASLLFPTTTLGKEYYSINYTQSSNSPFSNSFFFVVATEDNTTVEITPSAANKNGLAPNAPFLISLNKGQIYSVLGTTNGSAGTDLTGSKIRSVSANGSGGCKKIAVFSGAGKMSIGGNATGSADNLFAQALPAVAWGKKYLTVPTGSQPNNFYRICVSDPTTVVKLNGVVIPASSLINNFYYQFKNSNSAATPVPNLIESDKPIIVAQYCTTQGTEGNPSGTGAGNNGIGGDPEMIYLSPVEQTINQITLYSTSAQQILQSYINVVIKKGGAASFTLDGVSRTADFQPHPQDNNYSYAIFTVSPGSHTLYSDIGFNAIAYGFGNAESYGYNAGTNVQDFSQTAAFQNPYNRVDSAVTCVNTPLRFAVPISFQPTSIKWDFSAAPNISPAASIGPVASPGSDSSKTVNGQTLYYYSTNQVYTFTKANTTSLRDTIKIYTTSATPDGCGSTDQIFTIPVKVYEKPKAAFVYTHAGCVSDAVQFTDQSTASTGNINRWQWDFGDGTVSDQSVAAVAPKTYSAAGSYTIKLQSISDVGCISDQVTNTIAIDAKPAARFTIPASICEQGIITFTDASATPRGTLTKWTWDLDNGNGPFTNTANTATTATYPVYGTRNVSLQVETGTGCKSDPYTLAVTVNPLPQPGFILPQVCLNDGSATFTDTSKIAAGAAQFSYLWKFNDATPAVTPGPLTATSTQKNPAVSYQKADNYKVTLTVTAVNTGCVASISQNFTVNGSTPKADFEFNNNPPYCGTKAVEIKNKSTVDFGNVTRIELYWDYINNPAAKEVITSPQVNAIFSHSYPDLQTAAGVSYRVRMVAFSGGSSCSSVLYKDITVFPQPKAGFSMSATSICSGKQVSFTDASSSSSGTISSWHWELGKNSSSALQNPQKTYTDSGIMNISLYILNSNGCNSDTLIQPLTVYPNPKLTLPNDLLILAGGRVTIVPTTIYGNQLSYKWTPATYLSSDIIATPVATPVNDITYQLTVTAQGGCTATAHVRISVLQAPDVPNAFSPNGDGINDTWKIKYLDSYPGAVVEVYNRYGQIVFRSVGYGKEWDGTYQGNPLPVATYYYIINPGNGRQAMTGSVTIIK
ncbi:PKD domain-containing protein [Sediminibacterium ginsengisoli]|uniref:Gliding motility-associated C-terminal domain-containing protein n=1 Tax=Sediminibacterium ginsengisoli TaxID=413434 RepID=A0A1T4R9W1_9BACT|nr:PKD domain-containing protein [Sediminibacterium ginsengisoli]SKA12411.1 gliding motility-associated C-terminal domain-containing protein [Sediminibacterium ginsengisoli]